MTAAIYLNGATVMTTPTPRSLEIARETGYAGIEARTERLLADASEVRATAAMVRPKEVFTLNGVALTVRALRKLHVRVMLGQIAQQQHERNLAIRIAVEHSGNERLGARRRVFLVDGRVVAVVRLPSVVVADDPADPGIEHDFVKPSVGKAHRMADLQAAGPEW